MVISVSIPSYTEGHPTMYQINVDLGNNIQPYTLERRYNDFLALANAVETEMGEPPAVPPPKKPGIWEKVDCDRRRMELEAMLTALVRIPDFAESLAVGNFLEVFSHRKSTKPTSLAVDWVHTTTEISKLINSARSASHSVEIRQRIVQAKTLVGQLQRALTASKSSLGSGELARRQQQLDNYLFSLRQVESRSQLSGGSGSSTTKDSNDFVQIGNANAPTSGRVLGETPETRKSNNRGLMQSQQQVMDDQDEMIEDLRVAVLRQKELGLAIHGEIVKQNELLESLDEDVHRVNARLNQARRKTAELNR